MSHIPDLIDLLPHDMPLALVDELIDVQELSIHCRATISDKNIFFNHETKTLPAWVGIEFMAQSVAGWSGYHAWKNGNKSPIGFLLGSRKYQAECSEFQQGDTLDIFAEQVLENNGMAVFSCYIESNGQQVASSQLNVFVPTEEKLEELLAPKQDKQ
ncbi:hotdog family protein [Aliivibrio sp. S4TY2]|uniref:hotdog family protein n=1 Tax=unclassified Aliivibrio TaxID=2645654 RepID=UPI0023783D29|nr:MULTISPECIES: hotdog family protein [unclassified Aliivibrio]MDD9156515.1 hotdog family protein [Aliivibrio sp. S4TY2]MDD9160048.1 hotdog family protein [Aliivibrio sp. S4TY1]MDD9164270.1 hotdog family protein [Aliivibrio sp. S4MY2]MDD9168222.1 hotdog family protein [Aliivibrio sp. S4MY4]MDD9184558.1 hotdog family protein [Aliivibrio sp. S4MY3]